MKKIFVWGLMAIVFGVAGVSQASAQKDDNDGKIPGQYIIVFKKGVDTDMTAKEIVKNQGLGHLFTYKKVLKGFAAKNISEDKLEKIKNDPRVEYVAEDGVASINAKPAPVQPERIIPTGVARIGAGGENKGEGIGVAVLDTGIDLRHPDLQDNISIPGVSFVGTPTANDDNGHGTHVAGTIAALDNEIGVVGVAPKAKLIPVKVLSKKGSGAFSGIIMGIEWVTINANKYDIKVANMSLGGTAVRPITYCGVADSDPVHQAICASRDAGITYVVAAGNAGTDAATQIPAAYEDAVITVSALADYDGLAGELDKTISSFGADDTFATFSNYNNDIVDLGAPGVYIRSTYKGGTYATLSGTSMAAPHVSGAAALYLSANSSTVINEKTFEVVRDALVEMGEDAGTTTHLSSKLHQEKVLNVRGL